MNGVYNTLASVGCTPEYDYNLNLRYITSISTAFYYSDVSSSTNYIESFMSGTHLVTTGMTTRWRRQRRRRHLLLYLRYLHL